MPDSSAPSGGGSGGCSHLWSCERRPKGNVPKRDRRGRRGPRWARSPSEPSGQEGTTAVSERPARHSLPVGQRTSGDPPESPLTALEDQLDRRCSLYLGRGDEVWGPFRHAPAPAAAAALACCHLRLAISLGGCSSWFAHCRVADRSAEPASTRPVNPTRPPIPTSIPPPTKRLRLT